MTAPTTDGRIEIDAAIAHNVHGRRFLPGAGSTEWFQDIAGGPEMVVIPSGGFLMGSPPDEHLRGRAEGPLHKVIIPHPFAMSRCSVTFAQWQAACADGGCGGYEPGDEGWGRGDRPVINVSWDDAQAYVNWLRAKTGKDYRLPSEAEWEYAARAGAATPFWWGEEITQQQANYEPDCPEESDARREWRQQTVRAGSFQPNPWGLYQMHGNVWEWCEDAWSDSYEGAPTDGSPWTAGDENRRVIRGGSWNHEPHFLRAAFRSALSAGNRINDGGFRVARTLSP